MVLCKSKAQQSDKRISEIEDIRQNKKNSGSLSAVFLFTKFILSKFCAFVDDGIDSVFKIIFQKIIKYI